MGDMGFLLIALIVVSTALYLVRRNSERRARLLKSAVPTACQPDGQQVIPSFGIVEIGDAYDFLTFRKMFTPLLIQVIFWIAALVCVARGLSLVWNSCSTDGRHVHEAGVILGLALALLGPIVVRILCECLIVIFRMNDTLTEAKNALEMVRLHTEAGLTLNREPMEIRSPGAGLPGHP